MIDLLLAILVIAIPAALVLGFAGVVIGCIFDIADGNKHTGATTHRLPSGTQGPRP